MPEAYTNDQGYTRLSGGQWTPSNGAQGSKIPSASQSAIFEDEYNSRPTVAGQVQDEIGRLNADQFRTVSNGAVNNRLWGAQQEDGSFKASDDILSILGNSDYLPNQISNQQQSPLANQDRIDFMQNPLPFNQEPAQMYGQSGVTSSAQANPTYAPDLSATGVAPARGSLQNMGASAADALARPPSGPSMARDNGQAMARGGNLGSKAPSAPASGNPMPQGQPQLGGSDDFAGGKSPSTAMTKSPLSEPWRYDPPPAGTTGTGSWTESPVGGWSPTQISWMNSNGNRGNPPPREDGQEYERRWLPSYNGPM